MINIAIDGPAGAGKSSVAKEVAKRLGFIYVDTGALYRSIGVYALNNGIETDNRQAIINILPSVDIKLKYVDENQCVFLNGKDVSDEIRLPQASMAASNVSAIPEVRAFLLDLQRDMAKNNNVVMDGRDIGTVILPDAQYKFFLTASAEVRADRRFKELKNKGMDVNYDDILSDIIQRDYNDMHRETAPLKQADDAIFVDSSDMTIEESIEAIASRVKV